MMLLWRRQRAVHRYRLYWQRRRRRHDSDQLPCQRTAVQAEQRPQHAQLRRQLRLRLAGHGAGAARPRRRCPPGGSGRQPRGRRRRRRRDVERRTVLLRLRCQVPDAERQVLLRVWHGAPVVTSPRSRDFARRPPLRPRDVEVTNHEAAFHLPWPHIRRDQRGTVAYPVGGESVGQLPLRE